MQRPPIIGTAIRRMTSAPAPSGPQQRKQAGGHGHDRHDLGPEALDAAFQVSRDDVGARAYATFARPSQERGVQIDDHHHRRLHRQADHQQKPRPDRRRQRIAGQVKHPDAAHQRERNGGQHDERLDEASEQDAQQQHHRDHDGGRDPRQPALARRQQVELAGPGDGLPRLQRELPAALCRGQNALRRGHVAAGVGPFGQIDEDVRHGSPVLGPQRARPGNRADLSQQRQRNRRGRRRCTR